jgi:hypothetical protein
MVSANPADRETERLERLERDDRKRRWDSVLNGRPGEAVSERVKAASPEGASSDAVSILAMLGDRLDRMERLAMRLESEIRVQEMHTRTALRRGLAGAVVVAVLVGTGVIVGMVRR